MMKRPGGKDLRSILSVSCVYKCVLLGLYFFIRGDDWKPLPVRCPPEPLQHARGLSAALESGRVNTVCFGMKKACH